MNRHGNENDENNDAGTSEAEMGLDKMERMSHSKGVKRKGS